MKKNLTDAFCRKVKPPPKKPPPKDPSSKKRRDVPLKFFDNRGTGLFFQVSHTGKKTFRIKYSLDGRRNSMLLGVYPGCSLKEAREKVIEARKLIDRGVNPSKEREKAKQQRIEGRRDTFRKIAGDWINSKKSGWSEDHRKKVASILEQKLYPFIGDIPVKEITPRHVLDVLNRFVDRGHHSVAKEAKRFTEKVFTFAVIEGKAGYNPATGLEDRLPKPPKTKHMAAVISPRKLGSLLLAIDAHESGGGSVLKYAMRLMPLVFVRTKELRFAEWKEIDWKESLWCIKAEKMKMKKEHIVPLSSQAIKILKDVHRYTGRGEYVFPNRDSVEKPIGRVSMYIAVRKMIAKEEMSIHGFRATARTLLRENLKHPIDWIETQLAHAPRDPLAGAYDRAIYLEDRRKMMQDWADYLDELKQEAKAEANRE